MKVNLLTQVFIGIAVVLLALYSTNVYKNYIKLEAIKIKEVNAEKEIDEIKLEMLNYEEKIIAIQDKFQREKIAREKLQMIKKQEKVYKFINYESQEEK